MTLLPASFTRLLRSAAVWLLAAALAAPAAAATDRENKRAMRNAANLTAILDGSMEFNINNLLRGIESGEILRYAPEQPIWILDTSTESILFYQGQAGFRGQKANLLVDDAGLRFGTKAINNAKQSKHTWLLLQLGQQKYSAYCHARYPTIVCSLIP